MLTNSIPGGIMTVDNISPEPSIGGQMVSVMESIVWTTVERLQKLSLPHTAVASSETAKKNVVALAETSFLNTPKTAIVTLWSLQ